jgi:1,4-alpha-glucan branching enzyme
MSLTLRLHYDNAAGFKDPYIVIQYFKDKGTYEFASTGKDDFGLVYELQIERSNFYFRFKDGAGKTQTWEGEHLTRHYEGKGRKYASPCEIWVKGSNAFVYIVEPRIPERESASDFLQTLRFKPGTYVPNTGGLSGLGAQILDDGRTLFGFFHPMAARVYVTGDFNDWQHPGLDKPNSDQLIEMNLYRGYFDVPNIWLVVIDYAKLGQEYKFFVQGGVPKADNGQPQRLTTDPYARCAGEDYEANNAVIIDPSEFQWRDEGWKTPFVNDLILYELSVYGITEGDSSIPQEHQGKFIGIIDRMNDGYFDRLGVSALSIMPTNEFSAPMGPETLGYNPSLYFAPERDFGSPDDYRAMVDAAHQQGLAVISDQVFNHTSNDVNPLWKLILEHPDEEADPAQGGLYFSGGTPWGNRVSTERTETQNLLIDVCKLMIHEYHVDGFRFDFTHSSLMDHGFLNRLADELQAMKPDVILIAENMPNESDLNRQGFNGFAQWSNEFHDGIKALLREGEFEGKEDVPDVLGNIFYFSKSVFASHTNNVVNYCESHDEHSVAHEMEFAENLDTPAAKERKARLGLFASMVALGQPMIYMGQEFNTDRPRNIVKLDWPSDLDNHGFFQWASRLICLRRRYPGLRLGGYNPAEEGEFAWVIGPWIEGKGSGCKVIGWHVRPNQNTYDNLVILLNFENHPIEVDLDFGLPGIWVRLASIDFVDDIAPEGTNSAEADTAIHTTDGKFADFVLPDSSGFIYKWEAPV